MTVGVTKRLQLYCGFWLALTVPTSAVSGEYTLEANSRVVGEPGFYTTVAGDTLLDVARDRDLGYTELMAANPGVDPWLPGDGRRVLLPGSFILPVISRPGIVINLASQRIFYFPSQSARVLTFPIGIGKEGFHTPQGETVILRKARNPVWKPPPSIRLERPELPAVIPPGPDNPLGAFALYLGWPRFLIHGTNRPYGVGRAVSHGCIRLYPEDIELLFTEVPLGTRVRVISQETIVAWENDRLLLQIYPNKPQSLELEIANRFTPQKPDDFVAQITAASGAGEVEIDWDVAERAALERSGMIVEIGRVTRAQTPAQ